MANQILWDANPSPVTLLSTTLNSLANDARVLSAEIDNTTALKTLIDFELYLATQGSARSVGACVDIYLLSSLDGTNYPGDASADPTINNMIGSFAYSAATTAERDTIKSIELAPGLHKIVVKNRTGQAFAASGNTLLYRSYCLEAQ
jgi:hypothetical protein